MTTTSALVSIVDDDESVRESLPDLLKELGHPAEAYSSAEEFLASDAAARSCCLILDISMPGISGPELHRELQRRGTVLPTIFITAHADENVRPMLLEEGAVECLFKPFSEDELLGALKSALGSS